MSDRTTTIRYIGKDKNFSIDVSLHCPWCGIASRSTSNVVHHVSHDDVHAVYAVAVCPVRECERASFLVLDVPLMIFAGRPDIPWEVKVFPAAASSYAPMGVPKQIAAEYSEALSCALNGNQLGAALVGRRVLQAAAREVLGGRRKDLKTEIDEIPDARLNKALKDQATHVRLIGNDAAHVEPVDAVDVRDLLDFVEQVLEALYVGPAKVAKLQAKRNSAKAKVSPPTAKASRPKA